MSNNQQQDSIKPELTETQINEEKQLRQFIQEQYASKQPKQINLSNSYQRPILARGAKIVSEMVTWSILSINLNMYKIGDEGMQSIISIGNKWENLKQIRLERNNITDKGLKGLSKAGWKNLRKISLMKNKIKTQGFREIATAGWKQLKFLELGHCQIGTQGAKMIRQANWQHLQQLGLNYNCIRNQGLRHLSCCNFDKLKIIQLANNKIDGKGMFYLQLIDFPSLSYLSLNKNLIGRQKDQLSEVGCVYLSRVKVKNLEQLRIYGNDITLSGVKTVLYEMNLKENCFLQLIRNYFEYNEICEDIKKLKLFCNFFE